MADYLGSSLHTRTSLNLKGNMTYFERLRIFMICEANQGLNATQGRNHHANLGSHQLRMETRCAGRKPPAQYLDGPSDNHDGIMQGSLCLLHELLGATTEDDGTSLCLGAASEEIVPISRARSYM